MKIKSLYIKNLNSIYEEVNIDFSSAPLAMTGLFAITGDTGAGKTTILDAITLGLYGRVHRNKEVKEVISYGTTESLAEVEFETIKGLYRAKWTIWRARKKVDGNIQGPERQLSKWNDKKEVFEIIAEKIRDVEQMVEEVSGLDYDRFCRSVLLSQGDFAAFLKAGERERSDLLEQITGTHIYTEISKAAFAKYRVEEEKLKLLQQELGHIQIEEDHVLEALQEELKAQEKEATKLNKLLTNLRKQIQKKAQFERWKEQLTKVEEDIELHQRKQTAFEPNIIRIKEHKKALQFQAELQELERLEKEIDLLNADIEAQNQSIKHLDQQLKSENEAFAKLQVTLEENLTEQQRLNPIFETVQTLDHKIQTLKEKLEVEVKAQQKSNLLSQELKDQKINLQTAAEKFRLEQKQLGDWLAKNNVFHQLGEDLPKLQILREQLGIDWKQRKQLQSKQEEHKIQLTNLQQKEQQLLKEKDNHQLASLKANFEKELPEGHSQDRSSIISLLREDLDLKSDQRQHLQELVQLIQTHQESLVELSKQEEELTNLRQEEEILTKQLMNSLEMVDFTQERLAFKKQTYDQQLAIANYDKDRAELKEGEECPLCFSTQHPFREKNYRPFVNQAKVELDAVQQQFEVQMVEHRRLLRQMSNIENDRKRLEGDELKELSGQVEKQFEYILEYENKIAGLLPAFGGEQSESFQQNYLKEKLKESDLSIAVQREQIRKLEQLNRAIQAEEQKVQAIEKRYQSLVSDIKLEEGQLKSLEVQYNEASSNIEKIQKDIDAILANYNERQEKGTFERLRNSWEAFNINQKSLEQVEKDLALNQQAAGETEKQIKKVAEELVLLQENKNKVEEELSSAQLERKELFGENSVKEEKQRIENQVLQLQLQEKEKGQLLNDLKSQWSTQSSLLQKNTTDKEKNGIEVEKIAQGLNEALQQTTFDGIGAIKNALLTESLWHSLEQERDALKQKAIALEEQQKELQKNIKAINADLSQENLDDLKQTLNQNEETYQEIQQSIGAKGEKLREQNERKKQAVSILNKIDKQNSEFKRWAKLSEIIGSADGKKFRVFAQGLTLNRLTYLANQHLHSLNGRYFIEKKSDDDLSLEIVDTFQANNRRSMNTLSGGESFLVSLALALGLSDLAGRKARIQSLFIDEGFGTLDENSLDMAISTLENLQASGKTIGVISHVKALKERIATQIQLIKKGSGKSELKVVVQ